jgi:DNA-binding beta-propeller fold protein YncE
LQIAMLRWYEANTTGNSFTVGLAPNALAFDGANIWVANRLNRSVTKLRASDGSVLGTFTVGGNSPRALAFDGANIWVANSGNGSVTKL